MAINKLDIGLHIRDDIVGGASRFGVRSINRSVVENRSGIRATREMMMTRSWRVSALRPCCCLNPFGNERECQ